MRWNPKNTKKGEYARTKEQQDETINELTKLTIDKEEAVTALRTLAKESPKKCDKDKIMKMICLLAKNEDSEEEEEQEQTNKIKKKEKPA